MNAQTLLAPHYLVFLLPFGVAVLLLLLSVFHMSDGDGGDGDASDGGDADGGDADGGEDGGDDTDTDEDTRSASSGGILGLMGVGRAPLSIVLETFCMAWGFCGYWANQLLVRVPEPTFGEMLPALGVALAGGVIGARWASELLARMLPKEESRVVSREALFGLTGRVLFPVTEKGGRIRVYDAHGGIHEESCRVGPGGASIARGRRALVMDRDAHGRLIVEEVGE